MHFLLFCGILNSSAIESFNSISWQTKMSHKEDSVQESSSSTESSSEESVYEDETLSSHQSAIFWTLKGHKR